MRGIKRLMSRKKLNSPRGHQEAAESDLTSGWIQHQETGTGHPASHCPLKIQNGSVYLIHPT